MLCIKVYGGLLLRVWRNTPFRCLRLFKILLCWRKEQRKSDQQKDEFQAARQSHFSHALSLHSLEGRTKTRCECVSLYIYIYTRCRANKENVCEVEKKNCLLPCLSCLLRGQWCISCSWVVDVRDFFKHAAAHVFLTHFRKLVTPFFFFLILNKKLEHCLAPLCKHLLSILTWLRRCELWFIQLYGWTSWKVSQSIFLTLHLKYLQVMMDAQAGFLLIWKAVIQLAPIAS